MKKLLIVFVSAAVLAMTNEGRAICISNSLSSTDPTFVRPYEQLPPTCPPPIPRTVRYDQFEFDLGSCTTFPTTLTATLCNSGACGILTNQNFDTVMFIYRSGGSLTNGTGLAGAFDPSNPCNNLAALNDDLLDGCPTETTLSGLTVAMGPGRFVVVVSAFQNGFQDEGNYYLSVTAPSAGCALTQVATCPLITVNSSPNPF